MTTQTQVESLDAHPEMFVSIQRLVEDGATAGWVVDIQNSSLADTSSRFFSHYAEANARDFADDLADLLIVKVVQVEDDVL